ncbi:hypothetical protein [Rhodobacter capsulatus]
MRADQDSGKVLQAVIVGLDGAPDESCTEGERAAVKAWLRKAKEIDRHH